MHWFTFVLQFVFMFSGKASGHCESFYDRELTLPTCCCFFVFESVDSSFLMKVKPDVIKDINFAQMSKSFVTVEELIECIFFAFSPLIYLLMGNQRCSMFLLELLIDWTLRFVINKLYLLKSKHRTQRFLLYYITINMLNIYH